MAEAQDNTKLCRGCGEVKAVSGFAKQRKGKYGVSSRCRSCRSVEAKSRPINRERTREAQRRYKEKHGDRRRAMEAARRAADPERTREIARRYRERNRDSLNARSREAMARTRAADPSRDKAACAKYYQKNREKHRESGKRWAAANREKVRVLGARKQARWRAENRERDLAKVAAWRERNRHKTQVYAETRRARKNGHPGSGVSVRQWREVRESYLGLCVYCYDQSGTTMDHVVPLAGGGTHEPDNVVPACKRCNQSKGAKPLVLWLLRKAMERAA